MKKHRLYILLILISVIIPLPVILTSVSGESRIIRVQEFFTTEDAYMEHMASVKFPGISISIHTIEPGDNFWKIARRYGVTIDTLIGANPHWENLKAKSSQKILVPSERGVLHMIHDSSAVTDLQTIYCVNENDIIIQKLSPLERIERFFSSEPAPLAVFVRQARPRSDYLTDNMARQFELRERFRSPLGGRFSSYYGTRRHPIFNVNSFHNGVDIAAPQGTMVGAAADGVVVETGWMGGYGKAVIICHSDGFRTLYGHLNSITTVPGRQVKAGSLIGRVGSTGLSTGPHLHFTLWQGNRLINPLKILW